MKYSTLKSDYTDSTFASDRLDKITHVDSARPRIDALLNVTIGGNTTVVTK